MEKLRVLLALSGDVSRLISDIIAAKADGVISPAEEAKIFSDVEQLVADAKAAAQRA